jgi:protein tyrosine phosphatase
LPAFKVNDAPRTTVQTVHIVQSGAVLRAKTHSSQPETMVNRFVYQNWRDAVVVHDSRWLG